MATKASLQAGQGSATHESDGSGASWAWFASCALLAGSAALAIAPRALHSTAPQVAEWARMGLTWPLLAGLGVVVAAIATTARRTHTTVSIAPQPTHDTEASTPLAEDPLAREISGELARVRGGLHDLRVDFVYVKDALSRLQQSADSSDSDSNHDTEAAIFRLAASLDQLSGRIEHELYSQRTWLASALEDLARPAPSATHSIPAFADPYTQGCEGPTHEVNLADGFVASDDDLHVEVTFEEEASWVNELGVLDDITEPRAPIPNAKTSPSSRPISADALLGEFGHGSVSDRIDLKMAQLRELLSDPAVQRALESQAL